LRILIIEDHLDLVANLFDFLEGRGHAVDAAYDAPTGLARARETGHDAIVLDLLLPGGDGLDVCRQLRAEGDSTPVLMLTARDTLNDKLAGFDAGADDYLVKPFALQELEARLQVLQRRTHALPYKKRLQIADLALDPDTRRVERAGRPIDLPPIPFRILEVVMRHSPRVVSRAEIEHAVWGDAPPDSDALRSHVYVLRTAIDHPFEKPLLRTVRGLGLQLIDPDAVPT
jgi:DNA-binding response OmpR family regulator